MSSRDVALRNKQRERQERGTNFQDEIRLGWIKTAPAGYRFRLKDGRGGTQPGDELVLLEDGNLLSELKRTAGTTFRLSFLRSDQVSGLLDFEAALPQNKGLVMISFHNPEKGLDRCFVFRLLYFMAYAKRKDLTSISMEHLAEGRIPAIELPRIDAVDPYYDMRRLVNEWKSL